MVGKGLSFWGSCRARPGQGDVRRGLLYRGLSVALGVTEAVRAGVKTLGKGQGRGKSPQYTHTHTDTDTHTWAKAAVSSQYIHTQTHTPGQRPRTGRVPPVHTNTHLGKGQGQGESP